MRFCAAFLAVAALASCASHQAVPPTASTTSAIDAALYADRPALEPVPLPPLSPPTRRQREIEQMSGGSLARWILGDEASEIAAVELYPARWGVLMYGLLWRAPRPAGPAGVCEISGYGVSFRIENENSLSHQERLDPPLRPFQRMQEQRFRVAGSTEPGAAAPDCTAGQPYWNWSNAPSAKAIYRVANLMERAQRRTRGGKLGFRLACSQFRIDERTGASSTVTCEDPRALLQRLRPEFINRIRKTACGGDISLASKGPCLAAEYDDPAAPDTYSFYMVRIDAPGADARSIEIVQGMMPPH